MSTMMMLHVLTIKIIAVLLLIDDVFFEGFYYIHSQLKIYLYTTEKIATKPR